VETERLMDIHEVAAFLNVSPGTLYHWRSEHTGPPCVRISNRCIRWRWSDVLAWVSERVEKPRQVELRKGRKAATTMKSGKEDRGAVQVDHMDKEKKDLLLLRQPNQSEHAVLEAEITGGVTDDVVGLIVPEEE
jgi:predicted DNA-binding transcriptional regulator AlpA